MGAAKLSKARKCRKCGAEMHATAAEIKAHAEKCSGTIVSRVLRLKAA